MSFIHFKTVYNLNFDKVTFDGSSLTLKELKRLIAEKSKFSRQVDFDLEITNVDTNQVYQNENELILKNTRVLVKRVIKTSTAPLRAQSPKIAPSITSIAAPSLPKTSSHSALPQLVQPTITTSSSDSVLIQNPPENPPTLPTPSISLPKTVYDSLAPLNIPSKPIVYVDETTKSQQEKQTEPTDVRQDEKAKLESILMTSMAKTAASTETSTSATLTSQTTRFSATAKTWSRLPQHINPANRPIPPNYVCVICKKPGHLKQLCPEAGTLPRPGERPKFPSGIPRTNLRPAQPGDKFVMLGPEGYVVSEIEHNAAKIVKKDKPSFLDEEEEEEENIKSKEQQSATAEQVSQIPEDLKCPFGDHIIKDAVLVPCCGHFVCCDECIRQKILNDENIECPYEKCDQEIGSLISITPFHETRKKVNDYLNELKNQKIQASMSPPASTSTKETNDAFLDLILSDVNGKTLEHIEQKILVKEEEQMESGETEKETPKFELFPGPSSPLQDSKISSSEVASQLLIASSSLTVKTEGSEPQKPIVQPALLPTPPINAALGSQEARLSPSPAQTITPQAPICPTVSDQSYSSLPYRSVPHPNYPQNYPYLSGYQSRTVRHSSQKTNIQIYPSQMQNQPHLIGSHQMHQQQAYSNMQYMTRPSYYTQRPRFPRPSHSNIPAGMSLHPGGQAYPGISSPGMIQPALGPAHTGIPSTGLSQMPLTHQSLMTEAEFYEYQERLKKETSEQELKQKIHRREDYREAKRRRSRSRSRSRSRDRYKSRRRSRSRSRGYSRERSRSRRKTRTRSRSSTRSDRAGKLLRKKSRSRSSHRKSHTEKSSKRSRSKSREEKSAKKDYSKGEYTKSEQKSSSKKQDSSKKSVSPVEVSRKRQTIESESPTTATSSSRSSSPTSRDNKPKKSKEKNLRKVSTNRKRRVKANIKKNGTEKKKIS